MACATGHGYEKSLTPPGKAEATHRTSQRLCRSPPWWAKGVWEVGTYRDRGSRTKVRSYEGQIAGKRKPGLRRDRVSGIKPLAVTYSCMA